MEITLEGGSCFLKLNECYFSQMCFNTKVLKNLFNMLGKAAYYSKGVSISESEITGFKSASPLTHL